MKKYKKGVAIPAILAVLMGLVTLGTVNSATAGTSKTITINYWTHVNPPAQVIEKKLIKQYELKNPNIKINYLPVGWDSLPAKLSAGIAGGAGPDIFNYFQSYTPGLASKGYLAPVDFKAFGVKDQAEFTSRYSKTIIDGFTWNKKIVGVPHEISTYQFWVNNDSFKAAGLNPVSDFPKTWADVATVGAKLQRASGGPKEGISLDLNNPVNDLDILDAWARQAGSPLFSNDGKKSYIDSPAAIKALQTWGDLVNKFKINDPSLGPTASTDATDLFGAGTAGMVNEGGLWLEPILKQTYPKIHYTVGQMPTFGKGNIGADLYGFGLYVPVTSKKQAAAWRFARYLTDQSDAYFSGAGIWLGDTKTLSSSTTKTIPNWKEFSAGFKRGYFLAQLTNYNQISQIVQDAIQRVVVDNGSVKDSLSKAAAQIKPLLNK